MRKKTFPVVREPRSDLITSKEVRHYRPHPNVATLIDWTDIRDDHEEDGYQWVSTASIWKYANGGDLSDLLDKGTLPESLIWTLLEHCWTVLDHLHFVCQPSVAHGDFVSRNIFVHWDDSSMLPCFKLGDFGCAQTSTPQYAAEDWRHFDLIIDQVSRNTDQFPAVSYSNSLTKAIMDSKGLCDELRSRDDNSWGDARKLRPRLSMLLLSIRKSSLVASISISDQDRAYLSRLRPMGPTAPLIHGSPEALRDATPDV